MYPNSSEDTTCCVISGAAIIIIINATVDKYYPFFVNTTSAYARPATAKA
jgi:hypothetical protein